MGSDSDIVKETRVVIDSRSRNTTLYPTPSSYEVDLPEDLFMIRSMRLMYANVPFSGYMIPSGDATNIRVLVSGGTVVASAQLSEGDYATGDALATELQATLDEACAASTSQTFSVAYDASRDSFEIRSTAEFVINDSTFTDRVATARVLGFTKSSTTATIYNAVFDDNGSGYPYIVSAPYRRETNPYPYLVLRTIVPGAEAIYSPSAVVHRAFAVIPNGDRAIDVKAPFKATWSPPLSRVSRIKLEFYTPDGDLYDFQNHEHRLDLVFDLTAHHLI